MQLDADGAIEDVVAVVVAAEEEAALVIELVEAATHAVPAALSTSPCAMQIPTVGEDEEVAAAAVVVVEEDADAMLVEPIATQTRPATSRVRP